jgi:Flp pilus assembly protein TadG
MFRLCNPLVSRAILKRLWADAEAAQIAEFALSLPLLVVLVVGIFDFSNAITLKQKLTNAAREGARIAAADPANDLAEPGSKSIPVSINDAWQVVDNYLLGANVNDCGLSTVTPTQGTGLVWTATSTGHGCPGSGITVTINRGTNVCSTIQSSGTTPVDVIDSCVTIQYAYLWQFNGVSGLVGGTFIGPSTITTVATSFNEN